MPPVRCPAFPPGGIPPLPPVRLPASSSMVNEFPAAEEIAAHVPRNSKNPGPEMIPLRIPIQKPDHMEERLLGAVISALRISRLIETEMVDFLIVFFTRVSNSAFALFNPPDYLFLIHSPSPPFF